MNEIMPISYVMNESHVLEPAICSTITAVLDFRLPNYRPLLFRLPQKKYLRHSWHVAKTSLLVLAVLRELILPVLKLTPNRQSSLNAIPQTKQVPVQK